MATKNSKTTTKFNQADFERKVRLAIQEKGDLSKLKPGSLKEIGDSLVKEMKTRIASGISPITGKRFPSYKNPKKYPGKKKPPRPVNLKLTGDFLKSLVAKVKTGKKPVITITFNDNESFDKEQGHREGANGQRIRPIIPQGQENFTDGILAAVRQVFRRVLDRDLK